MPFVQAKCPNCGGILAVDKSIDAAVCQFCNTPFIVEKAVNYYNTTNNVNVGAGAVVNVTGNLNSDFEIIGGELKKYTGSSTNVIIPNNVKCIGASAFERCSYITSITIPNGVETISGCAFKGCFKLKNINIPDSVTLIGYSAFSDCINLKKIAIPSSVNSILLGAFQKCSGIETITVDSNNTVYQSLGNCLIETKSKTIVLGCKNSTIPEDGSVTAIGEGAFAQCTGLSSITIPYGITTIGGGAFAGCTGLTSISIPDSVSTIETLAFFKCKGLLSVTKPDTIDDNIFRDTPWYNNKQQTVNNQQPSKNGGCYVATVVYGSYDCPEVWTLRRFRDYSLALTWYGRLFITLYYAISPTIVKWFGHTQWFNKMWRGKLDRMVERLQSEGFENTPYQDKDWK